MQIKTEQELRSLYENRELITFVQGKDYFNKLANTYFSQFSYGPKYDVFDETFYRILWEVENEYGDN